MNSIHLTNVGKLRDVINATIDDNDLTVDGSVYFLDNGPFSEPLGLNWGIPQQISTTPIGSMQATFPVVPIQLNAPFTISAFVRLSAETNWNTYYPLFSFTNDGVAGNSPQVLIDAYGRAKFTYTSFQQSFTEFLDPPNSWIGVGLSWKFVSFRYDHYTSKISFWLDGQVDEVILNGTFPLTEPSFPVFNTRTIFVGSSDASVNVWEGSISCFSIYNWALTDAETQHLKEACTEILGGSTVSILPSSSCNACTGASLPYGYLGMPDSNEYMYPAGSVVEYRTVARTWFTFPEPQRSTTTTCQSSSGLWDPTPIEFTEKSMACNPECAYK